MNSPIDQRERVYSFEDLLNSAITGRLNAVFTAMPGIITQVNGDGTVNVQPAVQDRVLSAAGEQVWTSLPLCLNCPVLYLGGGSYVITTPIAVGDEALLLFSCRDISAWQQLGGVQPQSELRLHHLSDAFALVGPRSLPKAVEDVSTTSLQIRSIDGTQSIELAAGGIINITAPGGCNINGLTIDSSGNLKTPGEGTFKNSHTVTAHKHGGVSTGSGNTGTPTG